MTLVTIKVDDERVLDRNVWTALVRFLAGYCCEDCGEAKKRLHAHHLNGDDKDNRIVNGRCLCVRCHGKRHPDWRGNGPCKPGCTCSRHRQPRCKPGCSCAKHKKRQCEPNCSCAKHNGKRWAR